MKKALVLLVLSALPVHAATCYKANPGSFKTKWTGFKFAEKAGVSGSFNTASITAPQSGKISKVLENASFTIDTTTLESGKKARNKNIVTGLFKVIPGGESFSGTVKQVFEGQKKLLVSLKLGRVERDVMFTYALKGDQLEVKSTIDLLALGLTKAYESIHKKCKSWHTKNGKSVTWSDIDVSATVKVSKTKC